MSRDILSEYGNDVYTGQAARATTGGKKSARDVMNYMPPQGPTNQMRFGPGLGGDNLGPCGTQQRSSTYVGESGSPGLGGDNCGPCGSQGKY